MMLSGFAWKRCKTNCGGSAVLQLGRTMILLACLAGVPCSANAQSSGPPVYFGRAISSVIDDFTERGVPFVYSTNLVSVTRR